MTDGINRRDKFGQQSEWQEESKWEKAYRGTRASLVFLRFYIADMLFLTLVLLRDLLVLLLRALADSAGHCGQGSSSKFTLYFIRFEKYAIVDILEQVPPQCIYLPCGVALMHDVIGTPRFGTGV